MSGLLQQMREKVQEQSAKLGSARFWMGHVRLFLSFSVCLFFGVGSFFVLVFFGGVICGGIRLWN